MSVLQDIPPRLRSDVEIRALSDQGRYVAKIAQKQKYLKLGEQERFLLDQFDGQQTYSAITAGFEQQLKNRSPQTI